MLRLIRASIRSCDEVCIDQVSKIKISYPKSEACNKTPLFIYLFGIIQIPVYIKIRQTDNGYISDSMSQKSTIPFKCYIYANTFFLFKEEFL